MFYSPLRYPGGKGKLTNFFISVFEKNRLQEGTYVEPYAGGASIALSLLLGKFASQIVINDFDKSIYAFWHSVLFNTRRLCELISNTNINLKEWEKQKKIQQNKEKAGLLELGFSTFFLNRTNHSGIIKAGVIGGKAQNGNFKMDARFNKKDLIKRIKNIAKHRKKIQLYNLDAIVLIKSISRLLPKNTLIYFDPPYYVKGKNLYKNYYEHKDHLSVSNVIKKINKFKWLVSYDDVPEIRKFYKENNKFKYSLNYSINGPLKGKELMIYNNKLLIPKSIIPTKNII